MAGVFVNGKRVLLPSFVEEAHTSFADYVGHHSGIGLTNEGVEAAYFRVWVVRDVLVPHQRVPAQNTVLQGDVMSPMKA